MAVASLTPADAARGTAPVRFALVGDTQGGEFGGGVLDEIVRDIQALSPDFVVFPGDLVGDTGANGWQAWANTTSSLGSNPGGIDRRLMTPGNHDRGSGGSFANWQNTFNWLPDSQVLGGEQGIDQVDYYVDYGGVRFVSISSDAPGQIYNGRHVNQSPPALDWLREVMLDVDDRNADADPDNDIGHVFTFSHRPVTTQNESPSGGTNGAWWRSMTGQDDSSGNTPATAFMPGHWHMYQPSRPDPAVDTMELISGTGGGGLEGAAHRNHHGFQLITVEGANVSAEFFGDPNGSSGGWNFTTVIDDFVVAQAGGLPTGELARYRFEVSNPAADSSASLLSKHHALTFNGGAATTNDPQQGSVLDLTSGAGFADARNIGDNNLAVLGDLTIEISARPDGLPSSGAETLVSFGGAWGSSNGSLNSQESANYAYRLALTSNGTLQFSWQHDDAAWETVSSSIAVPDPTDWHDYEIRRDGDNRSAAFFVDGQQLGDVVGFSSLPTGGGSGSLYIGADAGGGNAFDGWIDNVIIDNSSVELTPVVPGDLSGDGLLTSADWLLFAEGLGSRVPGPTDFTGDGVTNYLDFLRFRELYERANGPGSLADAMAVPEPTSCVLLSLTALAGLTVASRRRNQAG